MSTERTKGRGGAPDGSGAAGGGGSPPRPPGLEAQLLQAQRLAAIGEMTAMMAHEIRNALAGMSLCLRVLRDHADEADTRQTCLDDLGEGLRRINDSVSRALAFANPPPTGAGGRRCSLAEVVAAARRLTATAMRKSRVAFEAEIPEDLREVEGDPAQLEPFFVTLILNACKAAPEGSRLTLHARADAQRLRAEVTFRTELPLSSATGLGPEGEPPDAARPAD